MKSKGLVFDSERSLRTEPSATVLADMSRYGNDGAFLGDGEPDWVQLPSGLWCLKFDGSNDYVNLGPAKFDALTSCTVELWYKPDIDLDAQATSRFLFSFYKGANDRIQLCYSQTRNAMRFFEYVGGATKADLITIQGKSQAWHFVQCDFGVGGAEMWIDGTSVGTDTETECVADIATTTGNYIGSQVGTSQPWSGYIALPRIYNYALSEGQGKQIFESERHLFRV